MRNQYLSNFKLFFFISFIIILQSCADKPGVWHNEQISAGKRGDFHKLNEQALKGLKSGSMDTLNFLLSKELIEDANINREVELVGNQLKAADFTLLDEYYIVRDSTRTDSSINIPSPQKNDYSLTYTGFEGKNYIALFIQKTGHDKHIITLTYYEYDYGWKVNSLDVGTYTVNGKTGPELYADAKKQYAKNYNINALNIMQLADYCLHPSALWKYPQEDEMSKFYSLLVTSANSTYKFPLLLAQVPTHPKIFRVMNQSNDEGTYPIIYYLSSIKLKDTTSLKKENDNIKGVIGKIMPGMDKDKKYLFFSVYNEMPTADKSVDHFDITDKIDQ